MTYLDTHVVAWLYARGGDALSGSARAAITDSDDVRISPMVRLELQYLYEIGRVAAPATVVVDALRTALGLTVCDASFVAVAHRAEGFAWTRDPFDRLIVAHAALHEAPLVTKDETLHAGYELCVW